jgi:hypothetical protein
MVTQILRVLALSLCVAIASGGEISAAEDKTTEAIDGAAKQIVEQILKSASVVDQFKGYVYGTRPRVAIWPFDEENVPIAKDTADELHDRFTASFIDHADGRIDIIGRAVIRDLIEDMRATGRLRSAQDNPTDALLKKAQKIDLLVKGSIKPAGRDISLSFKAARVDAVEVAQSHPIRISLKAQERDANRRPVSLDQAMANAAKSFVNNVPDMKTVILSGLHYQDTGLQPTFARYVINTIKDHLTDAYSEILTGRKLAVQPLNRKVAGMRDVAVEAPELKDEAVAAAPGEYVLSGKYWEFEDALEVQLNLRNKAGKSFAWVGRVRLDSIGKMAFRPDRINQGAAGFDRLRENDGGGFGFKLTTGAGENPVLKLGELLDLVILVDRDAWVYCFYFQADGSTIQIFPNPYFWKHSRAPKLAGTIQHTIPGEETFPFQLRVQPPIGEELLKCFAATRDVTQDLPETLRGHSLGPLKGGLEARLSHIFQRLPNSTVTEASAALTVVE